MAPGIRLDDQSAWDDSALVNSWNAAVLEYQKYHSIAKSGKRLEDVLTEDELQELKADHGSLIDEDNRSGGPLATNTDSADTISSEAHIVRSNAATSSAGNRKEEAVAFCPSLERTTEEERTQDVKPSASMPQTLLNSVRDENMKKLMMSWYYAGYYTGLVTGQQNNVEVVNSQRQDRQ